ncbi:MULTISPECIES: molybdate ABC transporter substrate-binding protein [unclassified Luteococcus]|uniref:molybdate ABC transporter substrate-binding protein n=1 Tax=unclassified Luteococcus TaxID=2639923 RepID=UPI00313E9B54
MNRAPLTSRLALVAGLALALGLTACSAGEQESETLTVFAAASLKSSFEVIGKDFEAAHPGTKINYSFNGSSTLVTQLKEGAPADVFASADEKNMARATDGKLVTATPMIFATNVLTLAVAPGNPLKITGLDQSLRGRKLVVCADGVPCGNATAKLSRDLGITLEPVSAEQSVTDVLGKVVSGEADAGVVYATDAKGAGDRVGAVAIPGADKAVNRYPIAVTAHARRPQLAHDFVDAVTGPRGQQVLADAGFGKP